MRNRDKNKELSIRKNALKIIVNQGFDGLSMHKLAKKAGVSVATIYIYFKDRDDLILQLYVERSSKLFEATLENFTPTMSFSEGLRVQWQNRVRYCLENPESMHFMEQIKFSPIYERARKLVDVTFQQTMKQFVARAIKNNELVALPFELYWSIAFAPLYQLVKFHLSQFSSVDHPKFHLTDETIDQMVGIVLKALKP